MDKIIDTIRRIRRNISGTVKILRDEESRTNPPGLKEIDPGKPIAEQPELLYFENELCRHIKLSRYYSIMAIDSSTRVLDTPYFFMGIGAVSALNRLKGIYVDYPDANAIFSGRTDMKWLVFVPEITFNGQIDLIGVTKNPADVPYTPEYNKYVILDELRFSLENYMLRELLIKELVDESTFLLIDGPLYYVPSFVYQYSKLVPPSRGMIDNYVSSWKVLTEERVMLLEKYYRNNIPVMGVIKRLETSTLLSTLDPLEISLGNKINDQAYLSILVSRINEQFSKPFILGPIRIDTSSSVLKEYVKNIKNKIVYYIGIPKRIHVSSRMYSNYTFYRIEIFEEGKQLYREKSLTPYEAALYDSYCSGTLLPLSIMLVDKRVKKLSRSLSNYLLRVLESGGIPLTYDTMRMIEGKFIE